MGGQRTSGDWQRHSKYLCATIHPPRTAQHLYFQIPFFFKIVVHSEVDEEAFKPNWMENSSILFSLVAN